MGKRAHPDSARPFTSRKYAADILRGDIHCPGGFIEGRIISTNPGKHQYTIDIRLDSKAKAAYLDIFIENKLQKRLGELLVGDTIRISLRGAQILPYSGASSHVPVILRFIEGITVLLVSRAGLQSEKEKFFDVWPVPNTRKGKKRRQALNVDNSDVGWFSSPPPSDGYPSVEAGTSGTRPTTTGGHSLTKSAEPLPHRVLSTLASSSALAGHLEVGNDTQPSTSANTSVASSSLTKSPLTAGPSRGAATYAYRTAPSREQSSPVHLPSILESSSAANSAIPRIPIPSTSSATLGGPQHGKQKSSRKKRREESKKLAASVATKSLATARASPLPIQSVPTVLTAVENGDAHDLSRRDGSPVKLEGDVPTIPADVPPEQATVAQSEDEEAGLVKGVDDTVGILSAEPNRDEVAALSMRAGLIANGWPYTALSGMRHSALMSIIGVVSSVAKEPSQSVKGDWCICLSLLDPSVLDAFGGVLYAHGAGTKINCFMRVKKLLPNPKQGDIILLRHVKIQQWKESLTGTCFANTMQWAMYDPFTEEVSQPDLSLASDRSHHPPTWNVRSQEREYCAQLVRWWAAVQRTRLERQGTAVQIGGGPVVVSERKRIPRQHLLISEADPGREPRGYFNCTVEILHGHANDVSDIYSIYVTDYTSKSGTFVDHSEWCPTSLADRVLRIEMWRSEAVTLGQQMNPGEYWSLDNVRMKVSNGGYIEGSFSEAVKARKLSIADVDTNNHFQALLQRKKAWEENDTNPHVFPHKLFDEVELQSIFDCTVEVLYAEYNATGTSTLYVTDYTERSDLATPPTALWSRELQGRIVTVELQGQQSKMADKMETGAFFTIKHLRLIKRITGVGKVVGRIGGPDRLIHKLNANNPNEELENLLERRKKWRWGEEAETARRPGSFTTIASILQSGKRVEKFDVRARVVGTFPLRLEDCIVRCCKNCSEQVPAGTDGCTSCIASDGITAECENTFHLFLRLQDERGHAQITVTVDQ
ncbi:hypothetical protein BJV74DRAFT_853868, partial [Russula compacta]